jgi:glycosyltransferase involved in cell wall biosynthesis
MTRDLEGQTGALGIMTRPLLSSPSAQGRALRKDADHPRSADATRGLSEKPLRVMVFLEASTIAGAVKPILEFAREAAVSTTGRSLQVTMVLYLRVGQESRLIDAIRAEDIPVEVVAERHPFDLRVIHQLRTLAGKLRPDIIWTNNTKSHFLVRLTGLHRRAEWIAFHHGYTREALRTRVYNELDRLSLPGAKLVVTVCHDFEEQLKRKGVPAARLRVLRNPIRVPSPASERETTRLRTELGLMNTQVLLSVGRLSLEKGHADLFRAIALLREKQATSFRSHLLIVGDGPERRNLQALCSELRLDDVARFTGYQSDVRPYYAISDVFVLPSYSEGSPNVLLEAMAAGLPVVAAAVGGLPEVLSHDLNALLVPKQDIEQLANAIERLLKDPLLRQELVTKGKDLVAQHNPQSYFQGVLALFEEVSSETTAT